MKEWVRLATFAAYAQEIEANLMGLILRRGSCMERAHKDDIEREIARQTKLLERCRILAKQQERKEAKRKAAKHG